MSACAPVCVTGFRHRVAEHAASGALRDLLEHDGLSYAPEPLSEGAVFGLSGALDLRVRIASTAVPAVDVDGRAHSLEVDLCRHLGIAGELCSTDDAQLGWQWLRAELDAGRPTLVRADLGELDYRGCKRHDTRHAIVVTGCDPDAAIAWVADAGFPDPQRCALDALRRARGADGWPAPVRHALLRLRPPDRLADPRAAISAALRRTVRQMRDPRTLPNPNARSGLHAIEALADAWPRVPAMAGPRLTDVLATIRFRIREGGTGGALYRSLQARFLHDAAALLDSAQLGRAALVCDDLADAWRALAATAGGEDALLAHRGCTAWVQRIAELERRHVEALERHLAVQARYAA